MSSAPSAEEASFLARSRRFGLLAVALVAVGLTTAASARIIRAALFPPAVGAPISCSAGVLELYRATQRAVGKAALQVDGERAALRDFRASLEPEWSRYGSIAQACQADGDARYSHALRQVELLRYAEERAVRYEALDLSRLRRNTPLAIDALPPIESPHP